MRSSALTFVFATACLIPAETARLGADPDDDRIPWWEDCDSQSAEIGGPSSILVYPDLDGDGYGNGAGARDWDGDSCPGADLDGLALSGDDCDDADGSVHPKAHEACDGIDNDCDDDVDEGSSCTVRGSTVVTDETANAHGIEEADRAGWALGSADFNGDGSIDAAIASLGTTAAGDGMVHLVLGPLGGAGAFGDSPLILGSDLSLGGSRTRSPDAHAFAAFSLGPDDPALLVVGAPLETASGGTAGAASGDGGGNVWLFALGADGSVTDSYTMRDSFVGLLTEPVRLGTSVAAANPDPDMQDGLLVLGAPESSPIDAEGRSLSAAGAAMLMRLNAGERGDLLTLLGESPGQYLGMSVAAGDVDGDGCADLVVGAYPTAAAGSATLITEACALEAGELPLSDVADAQFSEGVDDGLGSSIAIVNDLTGDGTDDVLLGVPGANVQTAREAGIVYLMRGASTVIASFNEPSATISREASYGELGRSMAALGDLDADDYTDLGLGAPGSDDIAPGAGAAWVLYGPIGMAGQKLDLDDEDTAALQVRGSAGLGQLGAALAPAGPGPDGKGDAALLGAPGANVGDAAAAGRVFYFTPD